MKIREKKKIEYVHTYVVLLCINFQLTYGDIWIH